MKRKGIALCLVLLLAVSIMPVNSLAEEEAIRDAETVKYPAEIQVNPLYADIITLEQAETQLKEQVEDQQEETKDLLQKSEPHLMAEEPTYETNASVVATQIREAMKARQTQFSIYYHVDNVNIADGAVRSALISSLFDAALAHTGTATEGDYIRWQYGSRGVGISAMTYGNGTSVDLRLDCTIVYYSDADDETYVNGEVQQILNLPEFKAAKTSYQKIKVIYDWICANVTYDHEHLGNDSYLPQFTAYAALHDHKCVCQGYAVLFYRLALECGVDARVVAGRANSGSQAENHAWNVAEIDSKFYLLDSTWDAGEDPDDYAWFLKGSNNFARHTPDADQSGYTYASIGVSETDYVVPVHDLNGDGKMDISDVAALYTYLSEGTIPDAYEGAEEVFRVLADLNGDGVVNILDYQAMYEIVVAAA